MNCNYWHSNRDEYWNFDFTGSGVGVKDLVRYPDTETHRLLSPEDYNFCFNYYQCYIKRNGASRWCGYVCHEGFIIDYSNLQVHGGISYWDSNVIGFDSSQWNDASPYDNTEEENRTYKDRSYVINELKFLTSQMLASLPKWNQFTHHLYPKEYRIKISKLFKLWYLDSDIKKLQTKHL